MHLLCWGALYSLTHVDSKVTSGFESAKYLYFICNLDLPLFLAKAHWSHGGESQLVEIKTGWFKPTENLAVFTLHVTCMDAATAQHLKWSLAPSITHRDWSQLGSQECQRYITPPAHKQSYCIKNNKCSWVCFHFFWGFWQSDLCTHCLSHPPWNKSKAARCVLLKHRAAETSLVLSHSVSCTFLNSSAIIFLQFAIPPSSLNKMEWYKCSPDTLWLMVTQRLASAVTIKLILLSSTFSLVQFHD